MVCVRSARRVSVCTNGIFEHRTQLCIYRADGSLRLWVRQVHLQLVIILQVGSKRTTHQISINLSINRNGSLTLLITVGHLRVLDRRCPNIEAVGVRLILPLPRTCNTDL